MRPADRVRAALREILEGRPQSFEARCVPGGRLCAPGSNVSPRLPTAPFKAAAPAVILARPTGFQGRAASLPGSNARGTLRGTQPEKSLFGG